jgi:hypothetical protein
MNIQQFLLRLSPSHRRVNETTTIRRIGRDQYLYKEGDHELNVIVELLLVEPYNLICPQSITTWKPPHDLEEITSADKERIIQDFRIFFENIGEPYGIDLED